MKKLDPQHARRITRYLARKLATVDDPRQYGKPLQGEHREYWRYRVGAYRVICHIEDDILRVLVVRIGHRREIYR
ncbi:type II toxin-antitoxin system RelE/ParE family toxin [Salinisphaera sp. P385]|uniref:Type II toxin-antitoxin system RelE/ParE family toxin n=1 Tax=Spectribacter acetivorans TaxID=3075603 RepID=A0ABU3B3A3_9GAMM|nr:type II toxin-antitoxin system RelE/ParE family toxin [Salinisphaera sp. P385]MDT0616927.1 type II toxin-antitoxin system RelE/ParE family toxin [Salinisphaera sp. P385]